MNCSEIDPRAIKAAARGELRRMREAGRQRRKDARQLRRHEREPGIFGLSWDQIGDVIAQVIAVEQVAPADLDEDRIVALAWRRLDAMTPGIDLRAFEGAATLLLGPLVARAIEAAEKWAAGKTKKARDEIVADLEREADGAPSEGDAV